ncbi:hypothetical protein OOU_Y34scaffold00663g9 [Pyricularia oryzae Y34]|nr:hypothetical protein OOU_Y34scaffold00663g9 [Pyricularia oryzae Y34]
MSTSPADGISKLSVEDASNNEAPPPHDRSAASPTSEATPANSAREVPASSAEVTAASPSKAPVPAEGVVDTKPARTTCGVCEKEPSKYKCPHCSLA